MIRKVLVCPASVFRQSNLLVRNLRTINTSSNVPKSESSEFEKNDYEIQQKCYRESTHQSILSDLKEIIKCNTIPIQNCIYILKRADLLYTKLDPSILSALHENHNFQIFCNHLLTKRMFIPVDKVADILIKMRILQIEQVNPLFIITFWNIHMKGRLKMLTYNQMQNLLIYLLLPMEVSSWTELKILELKNSFQSKLLNGDLPIVPIINLMNLCKIQNKRIESIMLQRALFERNWLDLFTLLATCQKSVPNYQHLLKQVKNNILYNIMNFSKTDIVSVLYRISNNILDGHLEFYDEKFINAIIDHVINNDPNCSVVFTLMKPLSRMNYKHVLLLNYTAKKLLEANFPRKTEVLLNLFQYAVKFNCIPNAHEIFEALMLLKKELLGNMRSKIPLMHVTYNMALMDLYDKELLENLFTNINSLSVEKSFRLKQLLMLVETFRPDYNISKLLKERSKFTILRSGFTEMRRLGMEDYHFSPQLEIILGGPQYFFSKVKTKLGISIDHVVIFRQGGYPVAINNLNMGFLPNRVISLESISVPKNCHLVFISAVPPEGYCINTGEIIGVQKGLSKCLFAINKNTIRINAQEFQKVPDSKKILWLAVKLKRKLPHIYETPF